MHWGILFNFGWIISAFEGRRVPGRGEGEGPQLLRSLFARLRIERSGFEPWPGTLSCVVRRFTLTVPLSTQVSLTLGSNSAMN